ncbi:hypothetical protein [Bacillus sp. Marseille-Q1617]|uniref:hypothetical protein n=1 Tax=Bacillus sp. Marseille-Q1617 TaxID=2736887 RepID=UPI00158DA522|nr:hypothetical protein [Bacillus sp. Marseille-Q1617]
MIWLYFIIPILTVAGVAIYFDKKSGMKMPDSSENAMKKDQAEKQTRVNTYGND